MIYRFAALALGCCALAASAWGAGQQNWSAARAAQYLDQAEERWSTWPRAELEEKTFCVSCHTASLYAIARPALRAPLAEKHPAAEETKLIDNVVRRTAGWNRLDPYYPDQRYGLPKSSESHGVESVFNALVLAVRDRAAGKLGDDTRQAFRNMWKLQLQKGDVAGSWAWMNFHLDPWEGDHSAFYGASFAAIATGIAPERYAASSEIQEGLQSLRTYVQKHVEAENLFNEATALWAAAYLPDLLTADQKAAIRTRLLQSEAPDGGWSMNALGAWKRLDDSPAPKGSDGYATGLAVLALKSAKDPSALRAIGRGESWLATHQDGAGMWIAASVNKQREKDTVPAQFMSDAATALAVLALTTP